jgi:hypothetical protein
LYNSYHNFSHTSFPQLHTFIITLPYYYPPYIIPTISSETTIGSHNHASTLDNLMNMSLYNMECCFQQMLHNLLQQEPLRVSCIEITLKNLAKTSISPASSEANTIPPGMMIVKPLKQKQGKYKGLEAVRKLRGDTLSASLSSN